MLQGILVGARRFERRTPCAQGKPTETMGFPTVHAGEYLCRILASPHHPRSLGSNRGPLRQTVGSEPKDGEPDCANTSSTTDGRSVGGRTSAHYSSLTPSVLLIPRQNRNTIPADGWAAWVIVLVFSSLIPKSGALYTRPRYSARNET